ncbi:UNVERIFIED_CONTAM: hypothetical protein FKN15_064621 [Acipenser sinensis]
MNIRLLLVKVNLSPSAAPLLAAPLTPACSPPHGSSVTFHEADKSITERSAGAAKPTLQGELLFSRTLQRERSSNEACEIIQPALHASLKAGSAG